jgi:zinc protease
MKNRLMSSEEDYRRATKEELYHNMFNARLREIAQKPEAPFMFAFSSTGSNVRSSDSFRRFAMVKQDAVKHGLEVLARETRRVDAHGFTEGELKRAKAAVLRQSESGWLERDKADARGYASELLRNFFEDESVPGWDLQLELTKKFLPTIRLDELNSLAKEWGNPESRVILIAGPEGVEYPSKEQVLSLVNTIASAEVDPYTDETLDQPLIASTPKPGTVSASRTLKSVGVTEWTLSNGAKVVIKPTDFKNDEVQFAAFSPGGHSLVSDADYHSAQAAARILSESGVGNHSASQLRKLLTGKLVRVSPFIGELEEGMRGSASPADLKTLFELVHLHFTAPRVDKEAFATWRASTTEMVRNRRLSPERSFFDDMSAFRSQNHLRRLPMTEETIAKVSHDKAMEIYKDRFADASDFTFVFVGNVDPSILKPMAETYLASLPNLNRKETWKDPKVRMPKGRKIKTTTRGVEPKSFFYLTFHGNEKSTPETRNNMDALTAIMRMRMREVLREDMGGVYSPSTFGGIQRRPKPEYGFTVFFGCDPENVDNLKKAIFDTISEIQKKGIDDSYIEKVITIRKRQRELDLKRNRFWSRELVEAYQYGEDPSKILDESLLDKVNSKQVRAAAKKYLRDRQYVLGVLRPEAQK